MRQLVDALLRWYYSTQGTWQRQWRCFSSHCRGPSRRRWRRTRPPRTNVPSTGRCRMVRTRRRRRATADRDTSPKAIAWTTGSDTADISNSAIAPGVPSADAGEPAYPAEEPARVQPAEL